MLETKRFPGRMISSGAIIALSVFTGLALTACASTTSNPEEGERLQPGGAEEQYVQNPLEPAWRSVVPESPASRQELLERIQEIAEKAPGLYGVYVYELDSGDSYGINTDIRFEAASTIKVPILIKLYKEIELGRVNREQKLSYIPADYEEGTGSIQMTGFGSEWTVSELAAKMMKESDNVAKNMLFRLLGYSEVETFAAEHGSEFDIYYNETTPRDMGNLLRLIYGNGVVGPELSREMIGLMVDTEFEDRLPRYLDGVTVAHKIGTLGDGVSDVGIVLADERPFVICFYSSGSGSEATAAGTIALIAATVYAYEVNR